MWMRQETKNHDRDAAWTHLCDFGQAAPTTPSHHGAEEQCSTAVHVGHLEVPLEVGLAEFFLFFLK
jgi:hypothetical protein